MLYINLKFTLSKARTAGLFGFSNIRPVAGQFLICLKGGSPCDAYWLYTQAANGLIYIAETLPVGTYGVMGAIKVNSV